MHALGGGCVDREPVESGVDPYFGVIVEVWVMFGRGARYVGGGEVFGGPGVDTDTSTGVKDAGRACKKEIRAAGCDEAICRDMGCEPQTPDGFAKGEIGGVVERAADVGELQCFDAWVAGCDVFERVGGGAVDFAACDDAVPCDVERQGLVIAGAGGRGDEGDKEQYFHLCVPFGSARSGWR